MAHDRTTRLVFIRHAQSVANAERRVQGWHDSPLSPQGETQAQRLAHWLRANNPGADVLFASPLQRTRQTADAVARALDLDIQYRTGLKEINLGRLEDMDEEEFALALNSPDFYSHGVEPTRDFTERVLGTLYGLLAAYHGSTLLVVTHLGVICTALAYWLDRDVTHAWELYGHVSNTAISELVFAPERVELLRHGDALHLDEQGSSHR